MHLNPYTILPLFTMCFSLFCGIFVIKQNPIAKLNRLFLMICITFIAWFSFYISPNFNYTDQLLVNWYRISFCFISFIPITTFAFIATYLQIPKNEFLFKINSIIGATFALLSISTDWIIKGVFYYPWHPYPKAGILYPFLILHCGYLVSYSIILTLRALRNKSFSLKQRNQIKYMFAAIFTLSFAMTDFIGNYGIPFYEIGFIPVLGYLIITTMAIIKHQLMDINIVIKRSLVYTILISIITSTYLSFIFISEYFLQNIFGYKSILLSVLSAIFLALVFTPLKNLIQNVVEKNLFKGSYTQIAEENELLRQEVIQTEKLKAIATLASGLAHEIRNPLTSLKTFAEYVPQKKNDPEFMKNYERIVPQEIDRINNLISDLLIFAKPSPPQIQYVNPNEIIQNLLVMLDQKLQSSHIELTTSFETNILISADPNHLKQALLNLILNAMDAMPNGGRLSIKTFSNPHSYSLSISDTGIGIKPEDLKQIFDPFFTKKEHGTGLGLSITLGIIEKHGGKITVESSLNQGTTFIISLNLAWVQ